MERNIRDMVRLYNSSAREPFNDGAVLLSHRPPYPRILEARIARMTSAAFARVGLEDATAM